MADRIALLAHEDLVDMYTDMGYDSRGQSQATFGGGGWIDMVRFPQSQILRREYKEANASIQRYMIFQSTNQGFDIGM